LPTNSQPYDITTGPDGAMWFTFVNTNALGRIDTSLNISEFSLPTNNTAGAVLDEPEGIVLGHEITGEIIEKGKDVEYLKIGDLVSVPFNVACGRCRACRERNTGVCLNVNPQQPGGAYGYVDMGGWVGGQAEYVLVPYADFNLLKFPDKARRGFSP